MRRITLTVIASTMALALTTAPALARHRSHHQRSHVRHARVVRERFGRRLSPRTNRAQNPGSNGMPPSAAGTVASLADGVLVITLADGSKVSGAVTERTRIECSAPEDEDDGPNAARMQSRDDGPGGGDENSGGDGHSGGGDENSGGQDGHSGGGDDQGDQGDDNGDRGEHQHACGTSALVAGTVVQAAELSVSSAGRSWDSIDLITQ
jgi:hypothetical protein